MSDVSVYATAIAEADRILDEIERGKDDELALVERGAAWEAAIERARAVRDGLNRGMPEVVALDDKLLRNLKRCETLFQGASDERERRAKDRK
jgi:hypothetical protein